MRRKCSLCGGSDLLPGSYIDLISTGPGDEDLREMHVTTFTCVECGGIFEVGATCTRAVLSGSLGCTCPPETCKEWSKQ